MASITSTLALNDKMTSVLGRITKAMGSMLDSFDAMQAAQDRSFDASGMNDMRLELGRANAELDEMTEEYKRINEQQNKSNSAAQKSAGLADNLLGKLKTAGLYIGRKGLDFISESIDLYNTQNRAEVQLKAVLANVDAPDSAFDNIKKKAADIQLGTSFGDEALIGGAAEFATYMSDDKAIEVMMDTLADYAAGMSGGEEVIYTQMVDYATNLGKIMTGSFDAMTKKGFEFTEQQKEIIKTGTDMQKALVIQEVINESWDGLSRKMANTPTGKIQQIKNAFGDIREELAEDLMPAVSKVLDTVTKNWGKVQRAILALAKPIKLIITILWKLAEAFINATNFLAEHKEYLYAAGTIITAYLLPALASVVAKTWEQAAAWLAANWQFAIFAATVLAVTGVLSALGVSLEWIAIAIMLVVIAYAAWQIIQWALNTAMDACPIVWILALVIAIIVVLVLLFKMFTQEIVGAIYWLGALFKNIGLWCANLGIAIWTVIKNVGLWFANLGLAIWQGIKNVGAWFGNLGMGIWSVIKAAASNIATAFKNGWLDIQIGFWGMINIIMQGLKKLAELANKCLGWMGVNIDTSGLDFAAKKIDEINSKREEYKNISDAWAEGASTFEYGSMSNAMNTFEYGNVSDAFGTFDTFENGWGTDAYNAGAKAGAGIHDWMEENLSLDKLTGLFGGSQDKDYSNMGASSTDALLEEISGDTGSISDSVTKTDEDLKYLRDIAEREVINRFTTAEVNVNFGGITNNVSSDMDLDGVVDYISDKVAEELEIVAEGVHE